MTPDQKEYYDKETARIKRGGYPHEAFVQDRIWGLGSSNLGPLDPPVVGFGQDGDPYFTQYLKNWDEVNSLIAQLLEEATKAWGEQP